MQLYIYIYTPFGETAYPASGTFARCMDVKFASYTLKCVRLKCDAAKTLLSAFSLSGHERLGDLLAHRDSR